MTITINRKVVVSAIIGTTFLLAALIVAVSGCGTSPDVSSSVTAPVTGNVVVAAQQPRISSASQVAAQLNCGKFHEASTSQPHISIVLDAGICWIGDTKYGIDTFASSESRDAWLKIASAFGMNPVLRESAFMVFYKAGDQAKDDQ